MHPHPTVITLTLATALITASSMLLISGCGGSSSGPAAPVFSSPASAPASVERDVSPLAIDVSITAATEPHVAINPSPGVAAANKLFVFLPGTQGTPNLYRLILRSGAARGFHTLGLNYVDGQAVGVLCAASPNPNCYLNVRTEVITGQDTSPLVNVGSADAIVTRLTKAIAFLNQAYPSEGWGQYLSGSTVDWSRVVVGGHSQGGGHAGVMSKMFAMSRACYFASPADWDGTQPAAWEANASLTPASKQFGFAGLSDPSVPYNQLSVIWQTLGLAAFGSAVSVDTTAPASFGASHMFTTNTAPDTSTNNPGTPLHGITVRDAFTPKTAGGQPLFDPVWGHLCFE